MSVLLNWQTVAGAGRPAREKGCFAEVFLVGGVYPGSLKADDALS
jgi:hypothetical protein